MHSGPNVLQLSKLENGTTHAHLRYGFFLRNFECRRYVPEMQQQPSHYISCFFNFCNNCLFVEVSNNEIFDFLTSNSCFF